MGGDGNCLYRCISYHFYGIESFHNKIRLETYNYLKNNTTFVYEYCYLKENKYYIDIEMGVNKIKKKYFIEDFIENIKKDGFFGGFIELYIISKLYNATIFILVNNEIKSIKYYKKLCCMIILKRMNIMNMSLKKLYFYFIRIIIIIIIYNLI